jgi:hypothetical protein
MSFEEAGGRVLFGRVVYYIRFASNDPGIGLKASGAVKPGDCASAGSCARGLLESRWTSGAGAVLFVLDRARSREAGGGFNERKRTVRSWRRTYDWTNVGTV